jgi:hypothetical protein
MKAEEYRAILSRLPIKNPTPKDMAIICPHLTEKEAVEAFNMGSGYVAVPGLRIKYGHQVVSYHKEWVEEIKEWEGDKQVIVNRKNHPPKLSYAFGHRTIKSYADGKPHGDLFYNVVGMYKAMKFSQENWPENLILDNWVDILSIYIQDPTDLVNDKYHTDDPRTKALLYVTLDRPLNEIINDHSKPESELFNEAINQMTTDSLIWSELRGGRGAFTHFNCANCSHGLSLSRCKGCGYTFKDNGFRMGMSTPLSRKMVDCLEKNGHKFRVNPEKAWEKERKDWIRAKKAAEEWKRKRNEQLKNK